MAEAPYLRIAAEIKDRIARGELRPGQKIPSTRQITHEWGVAMATATKAIAALREDGVVDTKPGAGTVVRSSGVVPRNDSRWDEDLGRDRIVQTAIAVADAEGLPTLSMRRLAADLGVATMSLYRHVSSKDDLVLYMADHVFGVDPLPDRQLPDWQDCLALAARLMWTVCRAHPWVAEAISMTRPRVTPNLLRYTEWTIEALRGLGVPIEEIMHVHLNLFGHVRGLALTLQEEIQARRDTGVTHREWIHTEEAELRRLLATGQYPAMAYLVDTGFNHDLDNVFEYGLRLLLAGAAQRLRAYTAKDA